jgi:hypothetical protein
MLGHLSIPEQSWITPVTVFTSASLAAASTVDHPPMRQFLAFLSFSRQPKLPGDFFFSGLNR